MLSPFTYLFDTSGFVPRWQCGEWPPALGWLHIVSDLGIWLAYLAIPVVLVWFVRRRRDVPFPRVFWLFGLFIVACGTTHLLEAVIFYHPVYRLAAAVKLLTAVVSLATVAALVPVIPRALAMRTPQELEREVAARTAELAAANHALRDEIERRGQAERELAEQREWFRVVLASIGDAVVATDAAHRVAFLNPTAEALTGWAASDAVGRPLDEIVHTFDEGTRHRVESLAARVLRDGREVGLSNHTLLAARGGAERVIERSAAPIRAADGTVQGVVLALRDVTDREQAEVARARLAAIVAGTDDAVIAEDLDGTIRSWNPAAERLYGWSADEIVGRPVSALVPPDRRDELTAVMARMRRGETVPSFETVRVARGGRRVDVSITLSPVRGLDGEVIGYSKVARNVTALKRAEEEARRALAQLRTVVDNMSDGLVLADTAGNLLEWNPTALRMHGYASADEVRRNLSTFPDTFVLSPPGGAPLPLDEWPMSRVLRGEQLTDCELHVRRADTGAELVINYSGALVPQPDGRPSLAVLTLHDTTARRRAEEALRQSEARLRELADAMPQIVWTADPEGHTDYYNRRWYELTAATEGVTGDASWVPVLHPDDRERCRERWYESVRTGEPYENEYRFRFPGSGEYRWHLGRARPVKDASGRVVRWFGSCTDIHDQKRVGEELHHEREFLRAVLDNVSEGVLACDPGGRLTLSNRAAREIHGTGGEPLPAEGWADRFPRYWPNGSRIGYDQLPLIRALRGERVRDEEFAVARPDGERRRVVGNGEPLSDRAGGRIGAVLALRDVTRRRRAEEELRLREKAIRVASQGILITDPSRPDNAIVYVSPGFERLTGYAAAEVVGRNCRFLQGKDTDPAAVAALREAIAAGRECTVEFLNYRKDGTPFWNGLSVTPIRDGDRVTHFVGVQTDVTGRRRLEDQLRQAQKMEAVGQLAGGVAHDFNNLLTVINGYSELLLDALPENSPDREAAAAVREAGERATGLTSQLLAFSRQSVLEPRVVNPNAVVEETGKMLRRLIGEDVRLALAPAPRISRVRVDPGQFGQVLMNLAVNARDAMPTGGQLTVETCDVDLDEGYTRLNPEVRPGRYVLTAVSDTGTGMPPDVRARVFEPFFTTKPTGKGTGLGLATVYGIVKQSGGHVEVYSEVGIGTTFKVYLPAIGAEPAAPTDGDSARVRGGTEVILVVEDQDDVRGLAVVSLQAQGYTVLQAPDGPSALRLIERDRPPIAILVTDVVMPGMSGRQTAEAVRAVYPGLPVLFVSGYTDDAVVRHGILQAEVAFLRKPYTPLSLARKVREVLDAAAEAGPRE